MNLKFIAPVCLALLATVAQAGSSRPWELKGSVEYAKGADQYFLVYSSNEKDSGPNIYGRVLNSVGSPAGVDFRMNTMDGKTDKPVLSYNPSTQQFLVAWGRKVEGRAEIDAQLVGIDGKIVGPEYRISFSDLYDQRPAISYCPGRNRFLVTFTRGTQYDFDKGVSDVYGQFLGGDGALQGSNFVIAAADKNQFKSELTCDTVNDRFMVVWEDQRNAATQDDIYGQLISSDGTLLGGNFVISSSPDVERRPFVAANTKDGSYLVAWESVEGKDSHLVSQTLDSSGRLRGEPLHIGAELGGQRDRPSVAYLNQQNVYLVVFDNSAFNGTPDGIWGQFMEPSGKLRQTAFPLTTADEGQYRPDVIAAKNSFFAVWTDYRDTEDLDRKHHVYEYYGRFISNDMPLSSRWRNSESL